jgi:hypothetical protein
MKKVISFSLWGDKPIYCVGAVKNADLALKFYPGWVCRYHIGSSTPSNYIEELKKRGNVEIFLREEEGNWEGMFWRFLDASDPEVDIMLSRDTDSRLNKREAAAVSEWLKSDKNFHIMRDHPQHFTEILGGMWGTRGNILPNMRKMIDDYTKGNFWQVDQNFLREKIYPIIRNHACVHDEFFEKIPFPDNDRENKHFVGQAYNENDVPLG